MYTQAIHNGGDSRGSENKSQLEQFVYVVHTLGRARAHTHTFACARARKRQQLLNSLKTLDRNERHVLT
jgi:hypothetical protein